MTREEQESDDCEKFWTVVRYCMANREVVQVIMSALKSGKKVNCKYPCKCNKFPCDSLMCKFGEDLE